eukprot:3676059-Pleurochrysis_carterae.AAC.1
MQRSGHGACRPDGQNGNHACVGASSRLSPGVAPTLRLQRVLRSRTQRVPASVIRQHSSPAEMVHPRVHNAHRACTQAQAHERDQPPQPQPQQPQPQPPQQHGHLG